MVTAAILTSAMVLGLAASANAEQLMSLDDYLAQGGKDQVSLYVNMPYEKSLEAVRAHQEKCVNPETGRPKFITVAAKVRWTLQESDNAVLWTWHDGYGEQLKLAFAYQVVADGDGVTVTGYAPTKVVARTYAKRAAKIIQNGGQVGC
jgi:hypothetical protein